MPSQLILFTAADCEREPEIFSYLSKYNITDDMIRHHLETQEGADWSLDSFIRLAKPDEYVTLDGLAIIKLLLGSDGLYFGKFYREKDHSLTPKALFRLGDSDKTIKGVPLKSTLIDVYATDAQKLPNKCAYHLAYNMTELASYNGLTFTAYPHLMPPTVLRWLGKICDEV